MESTSNAGTGVAVVTGGARGIGAGIVQALAGAGNAVAVADLNLTQAEETAAAVGESGGRALAVAIDITNSAAVTDGLAKITADLGPVSVLVNCAGWDELMPFVATDEDFWDKVIDINYKGSLRMIHGVLPGMIERGYGRIINIGSDAGRVGSSLEAVYSGAKGGIIAFTKTLAREVARKGITANTVCPGPTDTPMLQDVAARQGDQAEKVLGAMASAVPMKRLALPSDIANAVRFFASPDSSYITGQTLSVSGGLTMA